MLAWVRAYTGSADPYDAAANFVALVLAWNQPFYPLYLWFILGRDAWVGLPDILSAPLFFAVPAVIRRWSLGGRALLVILGVANTVFCLRQLGEASAIGLFFPPCAMLAAILFRWRERWPMAILTALPLVAWLLTRGGTGDPPVVFTAAQYASLFTMNAVSAGCLMVFLGWVLAGIHRDDAR